MISTFSSQKLFVLKNHVSIWVGEDFTLLWYTTRKSWISNSFNFFTTQKLKKWLERFFFFFYKNHFYCFTITMCNCWKFRLPLTIGQKNIILLEILSFDHQSGQKNICNYFQFWIYTHNIYTSNWQVQPNPKHYYSHWLVDMNNGTFVNYSFSKTKVFYTYMIALYYTHSIAIKYHLLINCVFVFSFGY